MAFQSSVFLGITPNASQFPLLNNMKFLVFPMELVVKIQGERGRSRGWKTLRTRVSDGQESYLTMWKNAVERERKVVQFQRLVENSAENVIEDSGGHTSLEDLEKKSHDFNKILQVPKEERDRIQRMQVIDRAAAAIAAARALVGETKLMAQSGSVGSSISVNSNDESDGGLKAIEEVLPEFQSENTMLPQSETSQLGTPGPDFWSWIPPPNSGKNSTDFNELQTVRKAPEFPTFSNLVEEKEPSADFISIPFESELTERRLESLLPPLQSLMDVKKLEDSESSIETHPIEENYKVGIQFSANAAEAVHALNNVDKEAIDGYGTTSDGSRLWKETGVEHRSDGVVCKWTLIRGISADQVTEWQNKFWEAADEFGYKELGSEKSGRDASGNVWREYWRESMWQDDGLVHLEKTADKWGKNGNGGEWHEKWWEHYDASGQAEKNAHKWCSIDPSTYVDAGHAHIWHERWGESYDGQGGSTKYTDKWAERCEADGWTKWGDKWDENFDPNGHGIKQGETWWEGKYGERWNRTWGERHNGSGWVHKYGKSSSGEHWDTHNQQETWYERFPHYGFYHCYDNSVQLREVQKPSDMF